MMMHGMVPLFVSLSLGYVLCVLAKKQEGLLKTLGYTLGGAILVLALLYGAVASHSKMLGICKTGKFMSKYCPMAGSLTDMQYMK